MSPGPEFPLLQHHLGHAGRCDDLWAVPKRRQVGALCRQTSADPGAAHLGAADCSVSTPFPAGPPHPAPLYSVLGAAIICASSFCVAFSQKRQAAAATGPASAGRNAASGQQLQEQVQALAAPVADGARDAEWGGEGHEGQPLLGRAAAGSGSTGGAGGSTSRWSKLLSTLGSWQSARDVGSVQGSTRPAVENLRAAAWRLGG